MIAQDQSVETQNIKRSPLYLYVYVYKKISVQYSGISRNYMQLNNPQQYGIQSSATSSKYLRIFSKLNKSKELTSFTCHYVMDFFLCEDGLQCSSAAKS